jgi:hypothetical protein
MLTCFWFAFAAVCFAQPWLFPEMGPYTIRDTGWSIGWVMLPIAAWNAVRWWMTRPKTKSSEQDSQTHTPA